MIITAYCYLSISDANYLWVSRIFFLPDGQPMFQDFTTQIDESAFERVATDLKNGRDNGVDLMVLTRAGLWQGIEVNASKGHRFIGLKGQQTKGAQFFLKNRLGKIANKKSGFGSVPDAVARLADDIQTTNNKRYKGYVVTISDVYKRRPDTRILNWDSNFASELSRANRGRSGRGI